MDIKPIVIENDVVESIFRPISMFLNDIKSGVVLTFLSMSSKPSSVNKDTELYSYKYVSSDGMIYSFTQWDFLKFLSNGTPLTDKLKLAVDKEAHLCTRFTVVASKPRFLRDGTTKMYPLFCFKGFDAYKKQLDVGLVSREKLREQLFLSGVLDEYSDKYYRVLDIDTDIIYYPKG
jgi:hypothetical protein